MNLIRRALYFCVQVLALSAAPSVHQRSVIDEEIDTSRPVHSSSEMILEAAMRAMHGYGHVTPQTHPWSDDVNLQGNEVVGYDIILTPEQTINFRRHSSPPEPARRRVKRKSINAKQYHWENGIIPYTIDESVVHVSPWAPYVLHAAMKHWMTYTCIKFEPYDLNKHGRWAHRVQFSEGTWCSSHLGKTGGLQYLFVHATCLSRGTIIHELGHTIGWFHEHARPDRDNYVQVRWHRIDNTTKEQYLKERDFIINTYGIPYDYQSIMHYPNHNGELMTLDRRYQHLIGQREGLSFLDQKLANKMYQCADHCPANLQCSELGFLNKDCECVCEDGSEICTRSSSLLPDDTTPTDVPPEIGQAGGRQESTCHWRYKSGKAPSVKVRVTLNVDSVDQCKLECLQSHEFTCRSFHYVYIRFLWYTISSQCQLTDDWARDRRFEPALSGASVIYYETPKCLLTNTFCGWQKTESLLITVDDREGKVNYNLNINECKLTCLEEQDFYCKSFLFRRFLSGNTVCVHTRTTRQQARSTEEYPRVDYYERKVCRPDATESTTVATPS